MPENRNQVSARDRVPPHTEEGERGILGCLLLDGPKVLTVCKGKGISVDSFYVTAHKIVWDAVMVLHLTSKPIDILTVGEQLKNSGKSDLIGGLTFLDQIVDATPTIAHAEYYAGMVAEKHKLRMIIKASRESEHSAFSGDTDAKDIVSSLLEHIQVINRKTEIKRPRQLIEMKNEKIQQWESARGTGFVGIPSGFAGLNAILGGYRRKVMCLIAGYRGEGKSSILRQECLYAARQGYHVQLFSMEDPADIASGLIASGEAGISAFDLDRGVSTDEDIKRVSEAWDTLKDVTLHIRDGGMTIAEIESEAMMLRAKGQLDMLGLDHVQKINPYCLPRMTRNDTMAEYSGRLADLAERLDVPILGACQFSRGAEKENRKPRLSDLRDSGTLEQDARQVLILRYNKEKGCYEIEVGKNNFGKAKLCINVERIHNGQGFKEIKSGDDLDQFDLDEI
jgi:replicative DNA helicase